VMTVAADLRSPTSPRAITRAVAEQLGAIDLLVNVAGTAPAGKFENISDDELESALDLHVKAPFRLIREVLPSMKERGSGCLIQLASTAGLRGYPLVAAYAAAKHGMIGMTRALAAELARTPIRVHAVCPGFVDTDITRQAAAAIAARGSKTESEILQSYAAMNACGRLLLPAEVAVTVADAADGEPPPPSGRIFVLDDMPPTYLT